VPGLRGGERDVGDMTLAQGTEFARPERVNNSSVPTFSVTRHVRVWTAPEPTRRIPSKSRRPSEIARAKASACAEATRLD